MNSTTPDNPNAKSSGPDEGIAKEREFIRRLDTARTRPSKDEYSAWEALVLWALGVGMWDDDFHGAWEMPSPMPRGQILSEAADYYTGPASDLELAFDVLVEQELFFTVHPGVFAEPCYYCSYDADLLKLIDGFQQYAPAWEERCEEFDQKFDYRTWRNAGLCWGGGSQGPSDLPLYVCVGSSCCWFRDGEPKCVHELPFNPLILPPRKRQGGP